MRRISINLAPLFCCAPVFAAITGTVTPFTKDCVSNSSFVSFQLHVSHVVRQEYRPALCRLVPHVLACSFGMRRLH